MAITIKFEKEESRKLPFTRPMRIGGKLFLEGFKTQLADESTFGVSIAGGLWQGLKYKGNIWRGIRAGAAIELGMCAMNGVKNVLHNYRRECKNEEENRVTYTIKREEE